MVTKAKDLESALKNSHINNLSGNNIKENISTLVNLFKNHVNSIITKKLTPTGKEQNIEELLLRVWSTTEDNSKAVTSPKVVTDNNNLTTDKTNTAEHYHKRY